MAKFNKKAKLMDIAFDETYEARRQYAFLYTARELTGRELNRQAIKDGDNFDWEGFKEQFDEEYSEYSSDELLEIILDKVYWIPDERKVLELFFHYKEKAQAKANEAKAKTNKSNKQDKVKSFRIPRKSA